MYTHMHTQRKSKAPPAPGKEKRLDRKAAGTHTQLERRTRTKRNSVRLLRREERACRSQMKTEAGVRGYISNKVRKANEERRQDPQGNREAGRRGDTDTHGR